MYLTTAKRCPRLPDRDAFAEEERSDYERMTEEWLLHVHGWPESDDGRRYVVPYFDALAARPSVAIAVMDACRAAARSQGQPGGFSHADHEMIDQVLAIDSGYFGIIGFHTQHAADVGVRIAALEALADGHEEDLTEDDRQQVEFIRSVRDGTMTDDIWNRMVLRLGSETSVLDYTALILLVLFHHRYSWALGVLEISRDEWRQMLKDYKEGRRDCKAEIAARGQLPPQRHRVVAASSHLKSS
jgi:hypothetical protein